VSVTAWLLGLVITAGSIHAAFEAARFKYRYGENVYLNVILTHLTNVAGVPVFASVFLSRRYRFLGAVFAVGMAALLFFASQGGRTASISLLGTLLVGYMLRYRWVPRRMALAAIGGIALIMMSIGLYEVRKVMSSSAPGEVLRRLTAAETYQGALTRDPLNYHQFLVAACEHFPADHPYLNGSTYIRLLVFYLPRQYFEWLKPPDTHNTFAKAVLGLASTDITIPPTMIGDGYINFWGPPGALSIMLLNGVAFGFVTRRMREHVLAFLVIGSGFVRYVLLALRGSPYEILTLVVSAITFIVLLGWLTGLGYGTMSRRVTFLNRQVLRKRAERVATRSGTWRSITGTGMGVRNRLLGQGGRWSYERRIACRGGGGGVR
jgi:hypothetical protein